MHQTDELFQPIMERQTYARLMVDDNELGGRPVGSVAKMVLDLMFTGTNKITKVS